MIISKIEQKIQKEENDDSEKAVSPVIGVILMVAITVILAAVIGVFVIDIGNSVSEAPPTAQFSMDVDESETQATATITHQGGDSFDADSVTITAGDEEAVFPEGTVSSGSESNAVDVADGDTVRVIWESSNGERTSILFQQTYNA